MKLKHSKTSQGNCFYTIRPLIKTAGISRQGQRRDHHCNDPENECGNTLKNSTGWKRLRMGESASTLFVKIKNTKPQGLICGLAPFFTIQLLKSGIITWDRQIYNVFLPVFHTLYRYGLPKSTANLRLFIGNFHL